MFNFQLFDAEHKFHPSILIYVFELKDIEYDTIEQHFFLTEKGAHRFWKQNADKITDKMHISIGGEVLWL